MGRKRKILTNEERIEREAKRREYMREYFRLYRRKKRAERKAKGETSYSLMTDEQKRRHLERHRKWYQEKKQDPEWMEKRRERQRQRSSNARERKKDFSDAEFSKWWHDKIESVRQSLS